MVAVISCLLVACGQEEEVILQTPDEVVTKVVDELGFPENNAKPLDNTTESDEKGILDQKVEVLIGTKGVPTQECTAVVWWHHNSRADLLSPEGGVLQTETDYDKASDLSNFASCF